MIGPGREKRKKHLREKDAMGRGDVRAIWSLVGGVKGRVHSGPPFRVRSADPVF